MKVDPTHVVEVYANSRPASRELEVGDEVTIYSGGHAVPCRVTARRVADDGEVTLSFAPVGPGPYGVAP